MEEAKTRWRARPRLAAFVRLFVLLIPAVVGTLVVWWVAGALPEASGFWPTAIWWAALIGAAVGSIMITQHLARKLLPLSWLLTLTLSFPDQAPSRLLTARRAAKRRSLQQAIEQARQDGLGESPVSAAAQAVVLVTALGEHDRRTRGHSERVRGFADVLAEEAGVPAEDRDKLRWGALLHDIGKLTVPGAILNKPSRPDENEWATLQRHPAEGEHLVEPLHDWLGPWAGSVAEHHERFDGNGYPRGLAGEDISLGGRILAIADAYEVMTATRAYKQPMRPDQARKALVADAGTHFDPELVRHFLAISLGKLWWIVGASTVISIFPWLAKAWILPAGASIRKGLSGPATATAAVVGLTVAGVVSPPGAGSPSSRPAAVVQVAAPAAAPAGNPPTPEPAASIEPAISESQLEPISTTTSTRPPPGSPDALVTVLPREPSTTTTTTTTTGPAPAAPPPAPLAPVLPPPPPAKFSTRGQLVAPSLLALSESSLQLSCGPSSGGFGVDGITFEIPEANRQAGAAVKAAGQDLLGLHDLRVVFYSSDCQVLGSLDGPGPDAAGALPEGAAFVVVSDGSGLFTQVELIVG